MITPGQCLEARKLLNWTRERLGAHAGVSYGTVWKFEVTCKPPQDPRYVAAIQQALEEAGVEFIPEIGGGPGVRLRKGAPE